jgi:hypothetical protein
MVGSMGKCEYWHGCPLQPSRLGSRSTPAAGVRETDVCGIRIRLKLLSEAGFSLLPSGDTSLTSKVLIRKSSLLTVDDLHLHGQNGVLLLNENCLLGNDAKSDVHTVPIDKSRSKVYNANLMWGLVSD